jgi:hypothetical protein
MDFSGIGVTIISCLYMVSIPPVVAGVAFLAVVGIVRLQGSSLTRSQSATLIMILLLMAIVAACLFLYFRLWQDLYVM